MIPTLSKLTMLELIFFSSTTGYYNSFISKSSIKSYDFLTITLIIS